MSFYTSHEISVRGNVNFINSLADYIASITNYTVTVRATGTGSTSTTNYARLHNSDTLDNLDLYMGSVSGSGFVASSLNIRHSRYNTSNTSSVQVKVNRIVGTPTTEDFTIHLKKWNLENGYLVTTYNTYTPATDIFSGFIDIVFIDYITDLTYNVNYLASRYSNTTQLSNNTYLTRGLMIYTVDEMYPYDYLQIKNIIDNVYYNVIGKDTQVDYVSNNFVLSRNFIGLTQVNLGDIININNINYVYLHVNPSGIVTKSFACKIINK